jgi:pilin
MRPRRHSVIALALLAAPAFAQETPRSVTTQVSEGRNLAAALMSLLARVYHDTGRIPSSRKEAGASPDPTDTFGKYVAAVDIVQGSIVVTYGRDADERIAGKTLVLSLYENASNQFWWHCGAATVREGFVPLGTYQGRPVSLQPSTVPAEFMPPSCNAEP